MAQARKPSRKKAALGHPVLQWIMGGLGLVVTLAAAGILAWEAMQPPSPPDLAARVVAVRPAAQGFVAEIEVRNLGRDTAAAVRVEGRSGDESASAVIDYVPGRGRATVELVFPGDPASVEARVTGWSEP